MSTEIVAALIAAGVSLVGVLITLVIGLRSIRIERDRLRIDLSSRKKQLGLWYAEVEKLREETQSLRRKRLEDERTADLILEKLRAETDRLSAEAESIRKMLHYEQEFREAEIVKFKAEADKISAETREIQQRGFDTRRSEIRELLSLFSRAVFDAPMSSEEPAAMFRAIRETRIALGEKGASTVGDIEIENRFQVLWRILLEAESEVKTQFPKVVDLAFELVRSPESSNWRNHVSEELGEDYYYSVEFMMSIRMKIEEQLNLIRDRLHGLEITVLDSS